MEAVTGVVIQVTKVTGSTVEQRVPSTRWGSSRDVQQVNKELGRDFTASFLYSALLVSVFSFIICGGNREAPTDTMPTGQRHEKKGNFGNSYATLPKGGRNGQESDRR